jgi:hypothetical protein
MSRPPSLSLPIARNQPFSVNLSLPVTWLYSDAAAQNLVAHVTFKSGDSQPLVVVLRPHRMRDTSTIDWHGLGLS